MRARTSAIRFISPADEDQYPLVSTGVHHQIRQVTHRPRDRNGAGLHWTLSRFDDRLNASERAPIPVLNASNKTESNGHQPQIMKGGNS